MQNQENIIYSLRASGFAIIENFIETKVLDVIKTIALDYENQVDQYIQSGGKLPHQAGHPLKNARALYCVNEIFQRLVMNYGIVELARNYIGDVKLRDCHLLINSPDEMNKKRGVKADVNWHRDSRWQSDDLSPYLLHCFLLLTDMTSENGGTLVVPGTHAIKEQDYYFLDNQKGTHVDGNYYKVFPQALFPSRSQVIASKGSLVFIDPMLIHAQGINVTDERRAVVNFMFQRSDVRPLMNCKKIAEKYARYEMSEEFLDILVSGEDAVEEYGVLNR